MKIAENKFSFFGRKINENEKDTSFSAENEKYSSQWSIKNSMFYAISYPLTEYH